MAHVDAREGKWREKWRMEWVDSTFHTTSEHGVSSITTADAHTSAASSRLNWRPRRFKCTRPFRRKTKSGFFACAITFQTQSTTRLSSNTDIPSHLVLEHRRFCQTEVIGKLFGTWCAWDAEKWVAEGFLWSVLFYTGKCNDKYGCSHL
jgi:hypothetical protein